MFSWVFQASTINAAYVADVVSPLNRSSAFGILQGGFAVGAVLGPVTASFIPSRTGALVYGLVLTVLATFLYLLVPESAPLALARRARRSYSPLVAQQVGRQGVKNGRGAVDDISGGAEIDGNSRLG